MGSLTLKQMRDLVVIDCGIEANPKYPPARVNKEINLAQRYVQSRLNGLGMKRWEVQQQPFLNTGSFAGQSVRYLDMDNYLTDMLESPKSIKFIECHNANNTLHGIAFEISDVQFLEQLRNTYTAPTIEKPVFMRLANKVYIAPSTVSVCLVNYYRAIPRLINDTDVSQMPDEFEDYVLERCEFQINKKLGKVQDEINESMLIDKAIKDAYEKYANSQIEKTMNETNKNKLQ